MAFLEAEQRRGFAGDFRAWLQSEIDAGLRPGGAVLPLARANEGFVGTFYDWALGLYGPEALAGLSAQDFEMGPPPATPEDIAPRGTGGEALPAHISSVVGDQGLCTGLSAPGGAGAGGAETAGGPGVLSVELLLSALEACGVDNARIEIEGGPEIPVLDGSSLGWALEVQQAGLRPAPPAGAPTPASAAAAAAGPHAPRLARALREPFTVTDGDAFIAYVPGDTVRISYGVDHSADAAVIGKQWASWNAAADDHYRYVLAPARTYAPSLEYLLAAHELGYFRAGTEGTVLIASGSDWWEAAEVRFIENEPARHRAVDLIGDLALSAAPGCAGLPLGHVLAFNADHDLHARFVRTLVERTAEGDWAELSLGGPEGPGASGGGQ